jgi:hypothetical protein
MSSIAVSEVEVGRVQLMPHVIWRETDDGVVVVDPVAGAVQVFNPVGSSIWKMAEAGKSEAEMQAGLVEEYEVSADQALHDLRQFFGELDQRGLIIRSAA